MDRITWDHVVTEFEAELRLLGRAEETKRQYRNLFRDLRALTDNPLMTTDQLRKYLAALDFKPATIANRYRLLHRFYGWLVEQDELDRNPMDKIKPPKIPKTIIPALSEEQVAEVLRACDTRTKIGVRDYAIMLVALDTGLRVSELANMLMDTDGEYEAIKVLGKGNKERIVTLGSAARAAVLRYVRVWRLSGPFLWASRTGRPLDRYSIKAMFNRVSKSLDFHIWPHLMRHTFATWMLDQEAPFNDVKTLMGHSSDAMLRHYTMSKERQRALAVQRRYSPADKLFRKDQRR